MIKDKYLAPILQEMCKRVDAPYDEIDFKKEGWFMDYEWTEKEEDSFEEWLVEYMHKNNKARRELMTLSSKNKKYLKEFAQWFVFDYGWKYKEN